MGAAVLRRWPPVLGAIALALLPLVLSPYLQDLLLRIVTLAVFALSLGAIGLVWLDRYRVFLQYFS